MTDSLQEAMTTLNSIADDPSTPKSIKIKIDKAISALSESDKEIRVRINEALQDLDEVAEDPNTPSFTRTQIWNVVSSLESNS